MANRWGGLTRPASRWSRGRGGLTLVPVEQVLRLNPEVIVTIDPNSFDAAWRDPLLASAERVRP